MKMQDVYQKLEEAALVPVLVIDQEDKAIPVCEALIKGGILQWQTVRSMQ